MRSASKASKASNFNSILDSKSLPNSSPLICSSILGWHSYGALQILHIILGEK